ncbi:MAG: aromatic amino acid ammonia-lyase [Methylocystis sp.]
MTRALRLTLSESRDLTIAELAHAAKDSSTQIEIQEDTLRRLDAGFAAACESVKGKTVYGVSTGLGPMLEHRVATETSSEMQLNLVRSHAAGLGAPLSPQISRATMLARLHSFTRNRSAVRAELASHMAALLNARIGPYIPRKGGVGASGDLVQLAHLALLIVGEGDCWLGDAKTATRDALNAAGLASLQLRFRDGLALINGLSVSVALSAFVCVDAAGLFELAVALSCLLAEVLDANPQAYAEEMHAVKRHAAQREVAGLMRAHLHDAHFSDAPRTGFRLQAPYSVRCAPQLLGPMFDALSFAERVTADELNSVSDNPIFEPVTGEALHGGNFHGEALSLAMDTLKIAIVKCSLLMERQLELLLNDSVNGTLPPFANFGRLGVDLGLQGTQFTAVSTAAENQTLGFPMSLHSISCNKGNQDVVSMSANAAQLAMATIDNAFDVAAVLTTALSQSVEAVCAHDRLSSASRAIVTRVRRHAPILHNDASTAGSLAELSKALRHGLATVCSR